MASHSPKPLSCCTSINFHQYNTVGAEYKNEERYKQAKLAEGELFSTFKLEKENNGMECFTFSTSHYKMHVWAYCNNKYKQLIII